MAIHQPGCIRDAPKSKMHLENFIREIKEGFLIVSGLMCRLILSEEDLIPQLSDTLRKNQQASLAN